MYLSDLIAAITKELKYLFIEKAGATVIFDTGLNGDYAGSLPICIFSIEDSNESAQLSGNGITRQDYELYFKIYPFEPNAFLSDDGNYSSDLAQVVDDLRVHFTTEDWIVQEMKDLTTNYGFRMSYQGTGKAEPLTMAEGLCLGFSHHFSTIAIDQNTAHDTYPLDINTVNVSGEVDFDMPGTDDTPIPDAPVATAGTSITDDSVTANWGVVSGAKGYFLDVARDELFATLIINNADLGNVLYKSVTGLDPLTDYYFRVRAYSDVRLSEDSNVISVTTLTEES